MSNNQIRVSLNKLNNIGDALREKRSEASQYTLDEMPEAIRNIPSGGGGGDGYIHIINPVIRVGNVTDSSVAITVTEVIPAE